MKRTKVMTSMATTTLGTLALVSTSVLAVDGGEYQTNGATQFALNTSPAGPVDPTNPDPDKPITPVDPIDPIGPKPGIAGPLSTGYASSSLLGGQTITSKNMTYYVETQKYKDSAGVDQEGPNFA